MITAAEDWLGRQNGWFWACIGGAYSSACTGVLLLIGKPTPLSFFIGTVSFVIVAWLNRSKG